MKIQCTSCATIFFIDDSLIAGKGVKAQCPRCGHQTVVRSNEGTAPPSQPSGLAYSQAQPSGTQFPPQPTGGSGISSQPSQPARGSAASVGMPGGENRASGFFGEQGHSLGQDPSANFFGGGASAYAGPNAAPDPLGHYVSSPPAPTHSLQANAGYPLSAPPVGGVLNMPGAGGSLPTSSTGMGGGSATGPSSVASMSSVLSGASQSSILSGAFEAKPILEPSSPRKTSHESGKGSPAPEQEATRVQPHPITPYVSNAPHEDMGRLDPTWIKIRRISDGQEIGPVSLKEVRSLYVHGKISLNDEYSGQDLQWTPIRENRSLLDILQRTPQLAQRGAHGASSSRGSRGKLWLAVVSLFFLTAAGVAAYYVWKGSGNKTVQPPPMDPADLLNQWLAQWRKDHPAIKLNLQQSQVLTEKGMEHLVRDQLPAYQKAISLFQQAMVAHPKNDRALAGLAMAFLWKSSWEPSSKAAQELQRNQYEVLLRKESTIRPTAMLQSACALFLHSEPDKALHLIQSAAKKAPQDAVVQFIAGDIWFSQHQDQKKALAHLQKAVQQKPTLARARILLARIYMQSSHYHKSIELLEPLQKARHPEAMYSRAQLYIHTGDHAQARQVLVQLINSYPRHQQGRVLLGILYYQILQQPALAQQTLATFPQLSAMPLALQLRVFLHRGYIALVNQQWQQAHRIVSHLLKLDKNYIPASFLQLQVLMVQKKYKEAQTVLGQLTARLPSDIQIQTLDAMLKEKTGQLDAAAQLYQQLSDQNTRYIWPRILLARIHLKQKHVNKSLLQIKSALEVEPDYLKNQSQPLSLYIAPRLWQPLVDFFQKTQEGSRPIFLAAAGMVAYQMDKTKLAHALLRRSLQEDSKGLAANLYMAQYHYDANRLSQAQQHAALVYQHYDQHPIAAQILGLICLKRRQMDKAKHYLNLVRKARPWFISSQVGLAMVLQEEGHSADALDEIKPLLDTYHYHHQLARALLVFKR